MQIYIYFSSVWKLITVSNASDVNPQENKQSGNAAMEGSRQEDSGNLQVLLQWSKYTDTVGSRQEMYMM